MIDAAVRLLPPIMTERNLQILNTSLLAHEFVKIGCREMTWKLKSIQTCSTAKFIVRCNTKIFASFDQNKSKTHHRRIGIRLLKVRVGRTGVIPESRSNLQMTCVLLVLRDLQSKA